jgi:hypothetical protein
MSLPCGVVVSAHASANDLKPAPALATSSSRLSRSLVERASRSSRVTISRSPGPSRFEHLGQLWPVTADAGNLLAVDLGAAGLAQLCVLRGKRLILRAHPCIAAMIIASAGKDAHCARPIERFGDIVAYPILGGLHHRYARI